MAYKVTIANSEKMELNIFYYDFPNTFENQSYVISLHPGIYSNVNDKVEVVDEICDNYTEPYWYQDLKKKSFDIQETLQLSKYSSIYFGTFIKSFDKKSQKGLEIFEEKENAIAISFSGDYNKDIQDGILDEIHNILISCDCKCYETSDTEKKYIVLVPYGKPKFKMKDGTILTTGEEVHIDVNIFNKIKKKLKK